MIFRLHLSVGGHKNILSGPMLTRSFYTLQKKDLGAFADSLCSGMDVFVPESDGRNFNFRRHEKGESIDLRGYVNTEFPPKSLLMPEGDAVIEYSGSRICEKFDGAKRAIIGIRPCDIHAVMVLDRVMLGHDNVEGHYESRRNGTILIGMRCTKAGENCFCESMGTSDVDDAYDMMLTDHGSYFHVEAASPEGHRIAKASRLMRKTSEKARKRKIRCSKRLDTEGLPGILRRAEKSRIWREVAERCLSCASCTFSCPTCYCFSFRHEASIPDTSKGKVVTEADYCMLPRFSMISGNYVFRQQRSERFRQFFYHKLLYGKENEGKHHCVGCGRCITECMAKIDITEEAAKVRKAYEK